VLVLFPKKMNTSSYLSASQQQLPPNTSSVAYRTANEARRQRVAQQNYEQLVQLHHKQRHDMLLQAVATRAPFLREETELRDQMLTAFKRSCTEIQNWNARMAKVEMKKKAQHAVLSQNVSRVVALEMINVDAEKEAETRRALEVMEEKCRLMINRVMQHNQYLVDCLFAQRRCIAAESRIRECFEKEELFLREEYQKGYDLKPWQPFSQLFGVCPFHHKKDCPFSNTKKSRLLHFPMDPNHYCCSEQ
jgi:hypothetical protein